MYSSSPREVTYQGRRAEVWTIARTKGQAREGERVLVTRWVDQASRENGSHPAGTVVVRHLRGTQHKGNLVRFDERVVADPAAYARHRLELNS